jgi:hypothetical protein
VIEKNETRGLPLVGLEGGLVFVEVELRLALEL